MKRQTLCITVCVVIGFLNIIIDSALAQSPSHPTRGELSSEHPYETVRLDRRADSVCLESRLAQDTLHQTAGRLTRPDRLHPRAARPHQR